MTKQQNEFVREKIKEKPLNRKRVMERLLLALGCGLVFALIFCAVVVLVLPAMLKKRGIDLALLNGNNQSSENLFDATEEALTETEETTETEEEKEIPEQVDLEDLQDMVSQLYAVGAGQLKTTVSITSVVEETDWYNVDYEKTGMGLGVVIASNTSEYQILCDRSIITDAKSIQVTFQNGDCVPATLKSADKENGLAVISVLKKDVTDITLEKTETASLGSSANLMRGNFVIALQESGISAGVITSTASECTLADRTYSMISTDIDASLDEPGVLLDRNGQIIGVILPKTETGNCVSAVSVSQLKTEIELLCSGSEIPYIGLKMSNVTDAIAETYNLPHGLYVSDVALDSPAVDAGIQAGDVLTEINGEKISSVSGYSSALMECSVGDKIKITVKRLAGDSYKEITCEVTVGQQ